MVRAVDGSGLGGVGAEPWGQLDAPRRLIVEEGVEAVALIPSRVVVFRLEVVCHAEVIVERIALLVVIGVICGKLVVPLKLKPVRELLQLADVPSAEKRLGRVLDSREVSNSVLSIDAES